MRALSDLFEATTLLVPCSSSGNPSGEIVLSGRNLSVSPLEALRGSGAARKLAVLPWLARNSGVMWREMRRADAVHAPIPGDVGTIGMLLAFVLRKPLFVRHCGNWFGPRTVAERFWKWFMQRTAGGRNVMLATGGNAAPPSSGNPALGWIFSTSLTTEELTALAAPREFHAGRCRLIVVCRQEKEKGTDVVLDSLPLVLKRFPDATLDVVGDGSSLPALKQQAAALAVADRVTFHGAVDHTTVIRLLQQADVFCYPTSASEGFPKVVLEALACGLPVLATRVSVLPDLLASGCGLLLDDASPAAVAGAIDSCLASADRYLAMSASAIQTARQYSLERWRDTIGASLTAAWGELGARRNV
jgi:hypothetical protein